MHETMLSSRFERETHKITALRFPILGDSLCRAPATQLIEHPALHACPLELEFLNQPLSFTAPP